MSVSVALATYNGSPYLAHQLISILNQTRLPDQVIVCDDASTDETLQIIQWFEKTAPFDVKVQINAENLGVGPTFNEALSKCTGTFIFLADQDDFWFPNKIERCLSWFVRNREKKVVIHDSLIVDTDLRFQGTTNLQNVRRLRGSDRHFVTGSTTVFDRSLLSLLLPVPTRLMPHDAWVHLLGQTARVRGVLESPLQYRRRHQEATAKASLCSSAFPPQRSSYLASRLHRSPEATMDALNRRREALAVLRSRLSHDGRRVLGLYSWLEATGVLDDWIEQLDERKSILRASRLVRLHRVSKLFIGGGYGPFHGVMTAGSDLMSRPVR